MRFRRSFQAFVVTFATSSLAPLGHAEGRDPAWQAAATRDGRVAAIVELAGAPAAVVYAQALGAQVVASDPRLSAETRATQAAQAQLARIAQAQADLLPALEGREIGAQVIYRVQRVLNAIAIEVEPGKLNAIRALPGVKDVLPLLPMVQDHQTSVPWIGAPQMWNPSGLNLTGKDIKVGVIDSGIDYIHKDFGGSGNYSGQSYTDSVVPWTTSVVGGTDFCGDAYDGSDSGTPDGDPMDCTDNGHGTHVAGTIGGLGVTAAGSTYGGPYDASTDYSGFKIGPGVAPGAKLYALRVFGCSGSTRLTNRGVEWALDPNGDGNFSDRLDVINLSLGSGFGTTRDTTAMACENAAAAGIVVVAAAGNKGDTYGIVDSPGVASRAISAAASLDSEFKGGAMQVTNPAEIAGDYVAWAPLFGPATPVAGVTAPVVAVAPFDACAAITNGAEINGRIALLARGTCTFVAKVKAAQLAGAVGVIVTNNVADPVWVTMAGSDPTITIPSVFISQQDGQALQGKLPSPGVTSTIWVLSAADSAATFTGRGPRREDDVLKPDLAAPGYSITSAKARSGAESVAFSGTSMATPHIAGAMALLKQLHPTWSVGELKALAMNTAADMYAGAGMAGGLQSPSLTGAGRVDLPRAGASSLIAYDADHLELVSISFDPLEVTDTASLLRSVRVDNKGATEETLTLGYLAASDLAGVEVSFPGGSPISVSVGSSTIFTVQLDATAAEMRHSRVSGIAATQDGRPRHWISEESGFVTLTPGTGPALRIPLRLAARPVATLAAAESALILGAANGTLDVHLTGKGLATGSAYPVDIVSLLTPAELQYIGEPYPRSTGKSAALAYAGVVSDYAYRAANGGGIADTTVLFVAATQADWRSAHEVGFVIDIDTNRDGANDFQLTADAYSTFLDAEDYPNDVIGAKLCPLPSGPCSWAGYANVFSAAERDTPLFSTNVGVLPVPASMLGLTEANAAFSYTIATQHVDYGDITTTPRLAYSLTRPGLLPALAGRPPVAAAGGDVLSIDHHRDDFTTLGSKGLLLIHHHNGSGARAQALLATTTDCALACAATVPATAATGSAAAFEATATLAPCQGEITYEWDFGDGSARASGASATHSYAAAGTYTWQLTANVSGLTCTSDGSITVSEPATGRRPRRRLATAVTP
ncbi:MAG: S8 family serine peptidase [Acidobacteriota bacterium]